MSEVDPRAAEPTGPDREPGAEPGPARTQREAESGPPLTEADFSDLPLKSRPGTGYPPSPMETLTTSLMEQTKAGDPQAFDELVRQVRGRAFHVARSLVGSRDDALDLCQEAFMKTYRARATYREGEPFLPWFHRILRNTCFSHLRKHKRVKRTSLSAGEDDDRGDWEIEDDAPPPSHGAETEELSAALHEGYSALNARDREILALRHFDELAYREIAETLGIPEGTVMSRLFHARRRLRERLAPHLRGALAEFADPDGGGL